MNNETLKRDLCARLLDGVIVNDTSNNLKLIGIEDDINVETRVKLLLKNDKKSMAFYRPSIKCITPYLFPTSALTKEIQIANYNNGEPFVPIERLGEELNMNVIEYCMIKENPQLILETARFIVIEKLNEWHINYRLSPDQFIEVTEENNPYK